MYKFGGASRVKLATLHEDIQIVLNEAIKIVDFSILEGYRGKEKQNRYFLDGVSKVRFPFGKHNKVPSEAVDIAPYPYPRNENEIKQAYYLAGIIRGIAAAKVIKIRIGCDWDQDGIIRNDKFQDVWHIEIVG